MKYIYTIVILLLAISMASCDDADDKIKRKNCVVIMHKGTKFRLYSEQPGMVDSIEVTENRYLKGVISVDNARGRIGYSANGLGYRFNNYNTLDNIYFNVKDDELEWIGNSSMNSGFFFSGRNLNKTPSYDIEFEFDKQYMDTTINMFFLAPYDNFIIHLDGKFTFIEKTEKQQME